MRRAASLSFPIALLLAAAPPADNAARYAAFDRAIAATKAAMMGEPGQALKTADAALALAHTLPPSARARIALATAQWLDGEAHIGLNQADAAAPLINAAIATVDRDARGTKLQGDLQRSKGAIAEAGGQVQEALSAYQTADAIFTAAHEDRSRAMTLQDIGRIYRNAGDVARTLRFYEQSADIYSKDPVLLLTNHNSRGELLAQMGRRREAEANYLTALAGARALGSAVLQVRVLTVLADLQIETRQFAAAAASVALATELSHAPGTASWQPFVLGEAAKLADARGDEDAAAALLDQTFKGVDLADSNMEFLDFHKLASRVYDRVGQPQLALAHLRAFLRLDSKARALTATYGAQLAAARFDFASQNLRISTLKTDKLQQEVRFERQHARMRSLVLGAIFAVVLAIVGFLLFALVTGRRSRDRLRRVNGELERALKAKTDFLAMTSHEIRTPLNGILGMTQVMLAEQALRPDLRDRLRIVHGAGETMRALVDDILDVAKMEMGAVDIVEEDVDAGALLDDVAALWTDQARAKGVTLTCDAAGLPGRLRLDPARLRQVVFNLLSNAVKFTGQGQVSLSAAAEGEWLAIAVRDTGIGIDPAQHELIFEPFQQADASTTRAFGGTGLGLAICRKLVVAMGGTVTVDSALGAGATFTVRLPLKLAGAAGAAPAERPRASELAGAHLLLVEGNLVTQGILLGLIEPHVAAVTGVAGSADALAALSASPIDHLVVEAGSAGMADAEPADGLRRLVAAARARGLRTTVLASPAGAVSIEAAAAAGADQLVLKPIGGAALLAQLGDAYRQALAEAA